jgi:hypothetical protein
MNPRGFTNETLLSDIRQLIGSQRELTARLLVYLAEGCPTGPCSAFGLRAARAFPDAAYKP